MDADVALVQEAATPPPDITQEIGVDSAPWKTAGAGCYRPWRTAVVKLSDRVNLEWLEPKAIADAQPRELAVSRLGTLAVAILTPLTGETLIVASMYAPWEKLHSKILSSEIYADASVHRVISDLSTVIRQRMNTASSRLAISISYMDMVSTGVLFGHHATTLYSRE